MDQQRYARVKEIFREAMRWAPEERAAVVATLAEDDTAVRDEVLSLLAHHDDAPLIREPAHPVRPQSHDGRAVSTPSPVETPPDGDRAAGAPSPVESPPGGGRAASAPSPVDPSPDGGRAASAPSPVEELRDGGHAASAPTPRGSDRAPSAPSTPKAPASHDPPGAEHVVERRMLAELLRTERAGGATIRWPLDRVIRTLDPIARALASTAERGSFHGAVRADHVVLAEAGGELVAELVFLDDGQPADRPRGAPVASKIESAEAASAAPEQVLPALGPTGPWTDVYALALLCVELMLGRPVADGSAVAALARTRDAAVQPTPRRVGLEVPAAVEAVMVMAMAMRPMERYQDARRFWTALRDSLAASKPAAPAAPSPRPPTAPPTASHPAKLRRQAWALGAAVLVLAASAAALAAVRCG